MKHSCTSGGHGATAMPLTLLMKLKTTGFAIVSAPMAAALTVAIQAECSAAAAFVFGGRRTYKASNGTWDRPKVDNPFGSGGMGAVAVVARYDTIDVQDGPYLGELDTVILGADWMPTKQVRLRLNYFDSDATNGAADSVSGVVARLGFDF